MKKNFKVRLEGRGPAGAWTFLPIPFSVEKEFGSKARVAVAGTINGHPFRNSVMPEGDGTHSMMVNKALKAGAGVATGDLVAVVMYPDTAKRKVAVPPELKSAFGKAPLAREFFEQLSPSRQKEYTDWVGGAKRPETKAARLAKTIAMLTDKRKLT